MKALVSSKKKNCKRKENDSKAEVPIDWGKIATALGVSGRSGEACEERYTFLKSSQVGKGPWSTAEDQKIVQMVTLHGTYVIYFEASMIDWILPTILLQRSIRSQKMEPDRRSTSGQDRETMSRAMAQPFESKHQQVQDVVGKGRSFNP